MLDDGGSYRERKEASISDLTGTTMLELVLVSTPIPMGMWLLAESKVSFLSSHQIINVYFDYSVLTVRLRMQPHDSCLSYEIVARQALATLGGGKNTALLSGWQLFTFETLVVLFPALASTIWPSHVTTMVLSMALSSENSRLRPSRRGLEGRGRTPRHSNAWTSLFVAFPCFAQ